MKQKKLIFNFFVNRNWKKLTDSRKRAKILADNSKSHHPIETLLYRKKKNIIIIIIIIIIITIIFIIIIITIIIIIIIDQQENRYNSETASKWLQKVKSVTDTTCN